MSRKSIVLQIFVFVVTATNFSVGQTASNPDSALLVILRGLKGMPLLLQAAVKHALNNATSVRKAEAAYLEAAGSVRREAGLFDPQLFFRLNYQDQEQPTASFFSGASILSTQQTTSRAGLRMDLPIGTEVELGVNTLRLITNSQFSSLSPEYDAFGSLTLRQPLLGGFAASARKQLTRSERELDAAKARYDQQELAVGTDVERAYWDLYAAERDYAVQKLTRDRGEAFLNETEVRAKAGLVGPNQVANARTFLAEQELLLLERDEQLDRQSDQLASLIGVRPEAGLARFIPTDEPPRDFPVDSIDVIVEHALNKNLDLQAARADVEAAGALANAAGWEVLPRVNLVGALGGNGLAGTPQIINFPGVPSFTPPSGSLGDALSQVTRRDFSNWSLGVEITVPIGFRSGLGEKDRLEAQVLSAQQSYIEKSRILEEQVRAAQRELTHGKQRVEAARNAVDAAQEQVRIGLIEFHNGRSTAFELVRLGADYAVAQQGYSAALVRTAKAAASLKQLTSGEYPGATIH